MDDQSIDLELDPLVAVASAAKEAVRRMRWREAGSILPGLLPTTPDTDTDHAIVHSRAVLVPCITALGPFLKDKNCLAVAGLQGLSRICDAPSAGAFWRRPYVAASGHRLGTAAVPAFGIDDNDSNCAWAMLAPSSARFAVL